MTEAGKSERSSSTSKSGNPLYKRIKLDRAHIEPDENYFTENTNNSSVKTQAAFVNKLYKMLEDPQALEFISWAGQGDSFSVSNPTSFSKYVLPQYFKHNNWQSFVRQLNMYGFHKVNDLIHSNLNNENQTWEFRHPHFKRGAISDLQNIKRKNAKTQLQQLQLKKRELQQGLTSFKPIEEKKESDNPISRIESHLNGVSKSCKVLMDELVHLRNVVSKQQVAMQDLIKLVSTSKLNPNCICSDDLKDVSRNQYDIQDAGSSQLHNLKPKGTLSTTGRSTNSNAFTPNGQVIQFDNDSWKKHIKNSNRTFSMPSLEPTEREPSTDSCNYLLTNTDPKSNERTHSFMMSFGKESHMLNPAHNCNKLNED